MGKGSKPAVIPLVPRTARTIDLAVGKRTEDRSFDVATAPASIAELHWRMKSIAGRADIGSVHPHMLRAGFIMAALDAGVPLGDVQLAARHADPMTTTIYDRRHVSFDRHAAYVAVALIAGS